ncbi:MAG: glycerate kinase, partial [Eubacteriales bacterium]|nr:glycerate kinase [Eubacteriales bacterium]
MDSFKGSLSSLQACRAVEDRINEVTYPRPYVIPVSDGGEGFVDSYIHNLGGEKFSLDVKGPYYEKVTAEYAIVGDGSTAVIEIASASGLCLSEIRAPLHASTYGTGEIIRAALDKGVSNILLGLGGSATNDGGLGMLCALGVVFRDRNGLPVRSNALGLADISSVDDSGIHHGLSDCSFTVCCDVRNKLLGPQGASAVYGPQKGASSKDIGMLEISLKHFRDVLLEATGKDIGAFEGSGAAGGLAAGLSAFRDINI